MKDDNLRTEPKIHCLPEPAVVALQILRILQGRQSKHSSKEMGNDDNCKNYLYVDITRGRLNIQSDPNIQTHEPRHNFTFNILQASKGISILLFSIFIIFYSYNCSPLLKLFALVTFENVPSH